MVDRAFVDSKGRMQMVNGRVKLQETSTEEGQPIKGSLQVTIMKMKGGDEVASEEAADPESRPDEKSDVDDK